MLTQLFQMLRTKSFVWLFVVLLALAGLPSAWAGSGCNSGDPSGIDCSNNPNLCNTEGCPSCVVCNQATGFCEARDDLCDDVSGGAEPNQCRVGVCTPLDRTVVGPFGCDYSAPALPPSLDPNLQTECYYCDPPVLAVDTCGNGVCDFPDEDCQNCPLDCLVPGFDGNCPEDQQVLDSACEVLPGIIFDGPPFNQPNSFSCEDGDVCTNNECVAGQQNFFCEVTPKDQCSGLLPSDLCCPAGCQGIPPGFNDCRTAAAQLPNFDINDCDPDCWPAQACGDQFVQNPETCDDGIPGPTAGLLPNGQSISEEDCRNPGDPAECTFCGDGIVQADAGEECDGADNAACGGESCDVNCLCNVPINNICITGSGHFWNTIRTGCGNCSLNPNAHSQGWWVDYRAFLLLLALMGTAWVARRRIS